ncbi:MAG: DUF615 domain-containing protein [Myxococcales bacterium]|nr:DUF615 domain-containing protein [Myxococcales bacterium]
MTNDSDDRGETRRQIARRARRQSGDRSARAAHALMEMSPSALGRLGLDGDLRVEVDRARKITSLIARRREERRLAGALRKLDTDELEARLAKVAQGGSGDPRPFQLAEAWRTRLLDGGPAATEAFIAEHAPPPAPALAALVEQAVTERATGKPRGAGRALFRHVLAALTQAAADPDADADDADDVDGADGADADDEA